MTDDTTIPPGDMEFVDAMLSPSGQHLRDEVWTRSTRRVAANKIDYTCGYVAGIRTCLVLIDALLGGADES